MEELIRSHLVLDKPNSKGWHPVLCKVCHDHGKKGNRAAFVFHDGGCSYNCFNCGISGSYVPSDKTLHKNLITVFRAFGIPDIDWQTVLYKNIGTSGSDKPTISHSSIIPTNISLPDYFYPLTDDANDEWCQASIEYLTSRNIDWTQQQFYCVRYDAKHPNWFGRIIIPVYYHDKLVFYQGRDLTDLHARKYLNSPTPRDNILYGYHNITNDTDEPLYIVEGWFDAVPINGVAVFSNKLTIQQIDWLNKTNRPKVIIPDRYGNGYVLANKAIELGWKVATPFLDTDIKDVNESIVKYGLLYTIRSIQYNTWDGEQAQILTNIYCTRG